MRKMIVAILLALVLLLGCSAALAGFSGTCSDTIGWTLSDTGVLTISGTGVLPDYDNQQTVTRSDGNGSDYTSWEEANPDYNPTPWNSYAGNIKRIVISSGITGIGEECFSGLKQVTSVSIASTVKTIGSGAFKNCTALTGISLPSGVVSVGSYAFYGCTAMTSVNMADTVTTLGYGAFYYCSALSNVSLSNGLTKLNGYVLGYCSALKTLSVPDSITDIASSAFYNNGLEALYLGPNISKIDFLMNTFTVYCTMDSATARAVSAEGSFIDSSYPDFRLRYVPVSAESPVIYRYIGNSSTVVIPDFVAGIATNAFSDRSSLQKVTIPANVKTIGSYAFYNCYSLKQVTITGEGIDFGSNAFSGCEGIETVNYYCTQTGADAWDAARAWIKMCFRNAYANPLSYSGKAKLNLQGSTTWSHFALTAGNGDINPYAFYNCKNDFSFAVNGGWTGAIGDYAFYGCSGLT